MSELDFASRGLVGSYVAAVIADATARAPFATRCTAGDVVRVRPGSAPRVDLADGRTLSADVVVLATGDDDPGPLCSARRAADPRRPDAGAAGPRAGHRADVPRRARSGHRRSWRPLRARPRRPEVRAERGRAAGVGDLADRGASRPEARPDRAHEQHSGVGRRPRAPPAVHRRARRAPSRARPARTRPVHDRPRPAPRPAQGRGLDGPRGPPPPRRAGALDHCT